MASTTSENLFTQPYAPHIEDLPNTNFSDAFAVVNYADITENGRVSHVLKNEDEMRAFLQKPKRTPEKAVRVLFLKLDTNNVSQTFFEYRLMFSRDVAKSLFQHYSLSSEILRSLFSHGAALGSKVIHGHEYHMWYKVELTTIYVIFDINKSNGTFLVFDHSQEDPSVASQVNLHDQWARHVASEPFSMHIPFFFAALRQWEDVLNGVVSNVNSWESQIFDHRALHGLTSFTALHQSLDLINRDVLRLSQASLLISALPQAFTDYCTYATKTPPLDEPRRNVLRDCNFLIAQTQILLTKNESVRRRVEILINLNYHRSNEVLARQTKALAEISLRDSETMKALTYVTVFFLPTAIISSICGTNFIALDYQSNDGHTSIVVDRGLGILMAVCVVMTAICLLLVGPLVRTMERSAIVNPSMDVFAAGPEFPALRGMERVRIDAGGRKKSPAVAVVDKGNRNGDLELGSMGPNGVLRTRGSGRTLS